MCAGDPPQFQSKGPENNDIEVKSELRDLGVQLSSDLGFKSHVEQTVAGASKLLDGAIDLSGKGENLY